MELIVQKREKFGKKAHSLRRDGLIPAELYGHGLENLHLSVPAKDFIKLFKVAGESTLINLVIKNDSKEERRQAMIHDVARNPLTDDINNIDFYQVRLNETIKLKIPINFLGEAPAIKDKGGILVKAMQEIEIETLPTNLPHSLDIKLDNLKEIGESVYVRDLNLPAKVKVHINPETVIATIVAKKEEEETATPEITVDSVKVETEEKKAERLAKKAASEETASPSDKPKS